MRKLILLLVFLIFLINLINLVFAENCELAIPRYGRVECVNIHQDETLPSLTFSCGASGWCSVQLPCLSNCQLIETETGGWSSPIYWPSKCTSGFLHTREWEVIVNGQSKGEVSSTTWGRDDSLIVHAGCVGPLTGDITPIPAGTSINYKQEKIMLREGWAGSLPDTNIDGSEGCILNKAINQDQNINSYLDPNTGQTKQKESSTYFSLNSFPTNWKIGDHYIFVKDWQTGIAGISLTYDKNNKGYWCGGQYGSRKIYNVQEITSIIGKCYAVPQSIYLNNVECCFPSDCIQNYGAQYTCNPENWKCEKTKPCNSQLECDQVFGEGVCQNKQINKWTCDTNKRWGNYAGTCTNIIKSVSQCPSDCTTSEYYNEEEGKCKSRSVLLECPAGKCCSSGGNYKPKSCSENLKCCSSGGVVGECKESCVEAGLKEVVSDSSGITGAVIGGGSSKSMWIIVIILLVIGGAGVTVYLMKKNKSSHISSDGECCEDPRNVGKKFCISCGKKLDKLKKEKIEEEGKIKNLDKEIKELKKKLKEARKRK